MSVVSVVSVVVKFPPRKHSPLDKSAGRRYNHPMLKIGIVQFAPVMGNVRASPAGEEVGVAKVEVGLARDKVITRRNHLFDDRRPDEYTLLMEPGSRSGADESLRPQSGPTGSRQGGYCAGV